MSTNFRIAETNSFQKLVRKPAFQLLHVKIKDVVYPQLRQNPFFGSNIKKLKGAYSEYYRFRIGDFRLFYTVDSKNILVFVTALKDRKDAY